MPSEQKIEELQRKLRQAYTQHSKEIVHARERNNKVAAELAKRQHVIDSLTFEHTKVKGILEQEKRDLIMERATELGTHTTTMLQLQHMYVGSLRDPSPYATTVVPIFFLSLLESPSLSNVPSSSISSHCSKPPHALNIDGVCEIVKEKTSAKCVI